MQAILEGAVEACRRLCLLEALNSAIPALHETGAAWSAE